MRIITREQQMLDEDARLAADAARSARTEGRQRSTSSDLLRNEFQRDRDKILHCKAFRRLSHKTQVFLAVEGDHFRTRLTHTLEVSQIARTVSRALALNEDLAEAIALGHDLGHTPFGHAGEAALAACLARLNEQDRVQDCAQGRGRGSASAGEPGMLFRHNMHSLRVVELLENDGSGLNLTHEVRDGIACHSGSLRAETLEGRVVALCDRIAYVNHDIDDALRAGLLTEGDLPASTHRRIGSDHSARIEALVSDLVETSCACGDIALSDPMRDAMMELRSFLFDSVYLSAPVRAEADKAARLITCLFDFYVRNPRHIPDDHLRIAGGSAVQAATDYIAGMTDRYASERFEALFVPYSLRAGETLV
ncbi:HD domain-containing protein [Eggerthellaceae bacterium zg-1084]|uniref:HD domain-containing protein n=1 Tax=Berryella wangjianweii TaxID=2734634 RepID=A0A6M8IZQ0_9ACTN|nr:HD domain-containing protein [Berryella wangjianweii]NPD31265.1 HD domain-containing protein [Berryella wangjianweii]NPD32426.1 HD domain-containing protein [Eggerthellaceae bacterium zg-997]QKF06814.1 HD domain-containing protein [Berryella wangjianweii]